MRLKRVYDRGLYHVSLGSLSRLFSALCRLKGQALSRPSHYQVQRKCRLKGKGLRRPNRPQIQRKCPLKGLQTLSRPNYRRQVQVLS